MTSSLALTAIPHIVKGEVLLEPALDYPNGGFSTPALDIDSLIWPRTEPLPLIDTPVAEIIEVLVATSEALNDDRGGFVSEALQGLLRTTPYEHRVVENLYRGYAGLGNALGNALKGERLRDLLEYELGGPDVVDGWRPVNNPRRAGFVRAFPTRIVHVLAGNAPGGAVGTIARGALMKGVHLLKLPSNDLLTASAVLRTMADVAPGHPLLKSFSAVYWRGGDPVVEGTLFRSQFFDKLVAWGGDSAIRNAAKYLGPGFELISFDPKNSISMIGAEALATEESTAEAAELAAKDSVYLNQEGCANSRYHYVEGTAEQVERYCECLLGALGKEREFTSARVDLPFDLKSEIEALVGLEPIYRVFGTADGRGAVVRSDEPVDFYPTGKTVNVVRVESLERAIEFVNVSTQTVGVHPSERKQGLRDGLASAGAQRVTNLGTVEKLFEPGFAHDGFFPLQRFVRWVNDEY